MDKDKESEFEDTFGTSGDEFTSDSTSRARNRTVMLTPDTIGQVREQLAKDSGAKAGSPVKDKPAASPSTEGRPSVGSRYVPGGGGQPPVAGPPATNEPAISSPPRQPAPPAAQPQDTDGWGNPVTEYVVWVKESPIVGFLVSYDENPNGAVFELRAGRLIVTSESPGSGNFLVVQSESVSPMHAIVRIGKKGDLQVLDQLSEFGTRIVRVDSEEEEELSGDKSSLEHGDVIYFGERKFHVCLVAKEDGGEVQEE